MNELSDFEEMYLKRMFEIHSEQPSAIVKTSMLADSMGVSDCLLYTSPSPRDVEESRMPSSA